MPSVTIAKCATITGRLTAAALEAFRKLVVLGQSDRAEALELQDKFHAAVCDLSEVRIVEIPSETGTFYVDDGVLYVSDNAVAKILSTVTEEYKKRSAANDHLDASELPELLEKVFVDFLLHEVRHRTQGVEEYDVVQRLKAAAGRSAMGEMDALADRDAAWAYASAEAGWGCRKVFLEKFREALFLSGDYYFKVFPISTSRHDKIERAIAVLLMAARLATIDFTDALQEQNNFPLDSSLIVALSSKRNELAIYRAEPSKRLLGVANDTHGVSALVADINAGQFDMALQRSVNIMNGLNLLG